jgi:hypothetical protein
VALTVEITRSDLLADLIAALDRGGCEAIQTARAACRVAYPLAATEREAELEIAFFLRAWQLAHPGVGATLANGAA